MRLTTPWTYIEEAESRFNDPHRGASSWSQPDAAMTAALIAIAKSLEHPKRRWRK